MPNDNPAGPPARLGVEVLEARTVPTTFGANSGMSLAVGEVESGTPGFEFITGTGPGRQALLRVFDSKGTNPPLYSINPFGDYDGGIYVALGDVNFDSQQEIIVSTAGGTTGRVKVYQFLPVEGLVELAEFTPFGPTYNGGVQIATGNVSGDRTQEIIVGMESGGSTVKVFASNKALGGSKFFEIRSFDAFKATYTGGVSVTAANVDATVNTPTDPYDYNYNEIIIGKSRNAPVVKIYDAQQPTVTLRAKYFAFNTNIQANRVGIQVVAGVTDQQRGADIYVVQRNSTLVRIINGATGVPVAPVSDFNVAYPALYTRNLNLTIRNVVDDVVGFYPSASELYVVGSEGPYEQVPVVFPGKVGSPAGLNGSRAAP